MQMQNIMKIKLCFLLLIALLFSCKESHESHNSSDKNQILPIDKQAENPTVDSNYNKDTIQLDQMDSSSCTCKESPPAWGG